MQAVPPAASPHSTAAESNSTNGGPTAGSMPQPAVPPTHTTTLQQPGSSHRDANGPERLPSTAASAANASGEVDPECIDLTSIDVQQQRNIMKDIDTRSGMMAPRPPARPPGTAAASARAAGRTGSTASSGGRIREAKKGAKRGSAGHHGGEQPSSKQLRITGMFSKQQ